MSDKIGSITIRNDGDKGETYWASYARMVGENEATIFLDDAEDLHEMIDKCLLYREFHDIDEITIDLTTDQDWIALL